MRQMILAALLTIVGAVSAQADPHAGQLGAGVEVGEQNGVTGKYWIDSNQSIDMGLGASADDDGEFSFHAGYDWHAWDILPKPAKGIFGLYAGLGFRVRDHRDGEFGLRPIAGADYWVADHPIEIFVEGGPVFELTPDTNVDGTAAVGVRFYFDTRRASR